MRSMSIELNMGMEKPKDKLSINEASDRAQIENSCVHCNRQLGKEEIKILPPSYVLERDPYVRSGAARSRVMCVNCYNTLRASSRSKVRFKRSSGAGSAVKVIIGKYLMNR